MTSGERVLKTLSHRDPDGVPVDEREIMNHYVDVGCQAYQSIQAGANTDSLLRALEIVQAQGKY